MKFLSANSSAVAIIDPPRGGLTKEAASVVSKAKNFKSILYLSCNPETLVRDLEIFLKSDWRISKVMPFDFFPKTKHIETLVLLKGK